MSTEQAIVRQEPQEIAPADRMIVMIMDAARDKSIDIDKLERLVAMQERMVAEQKRLAFDDAMTRLQAKMPQFTQFGAGKNNKFAKYEDIDIVLRPKLAEEGFNLSFSEEARTETTVTYVLEVSRAGHSKFHRMTCSVDRAAKNQAGASIRPAIQDDGSTASYARRYLLKLALNIVETGEDTDGESKKPISEEEVRDLETAAKDVFGDNLNRFLVYLKIGALSELCKSDLKKAHVAIEVKRSENAKKK